MERPNVLPGWGEHSSVEREQMYKGLELCCQRLSGERVCPGCRKQAMQCCWVNGIRI